MQKPVPKPLPLRKMLLGPLLIVLGLGIGAGELILWPQLAAQYGLILVWAALVSLAIQTLWTQEMMRFTLFTGEHFVLYMARIFGLATSVILFGIISWLSIGFPAWATSAGSAFAILFNWPGNLETATVFWGAIGFIATILVVAFSHIIRKSLEYILLLVLVVTWLSMFPALYLLDNFSSLGQLVLAIPKYFGQLPQDVSFWTLTSAISFIGAGGIANMWYTFWLRDSDYAMAKYAGHIRGLRGGKSKVAIAGVLPKADKVNLQRIKTWLRNSQYAMWIIFFGLNLLTTYLFVALAYAGLYEEGLVPKGYEIALTLSKIYEKAFGPWGATFYLIIFGLQLWSTQLSITEGLVRQIAENAYIASKKVRDWCKQDIRKIYFAVLLVFSAWGILWLAMDKMFKFVNPEFLLKLSANATLVFQIISIPLVLYFNYFVARKALPKKVWEVYKPSIWIGIFLILGMLFYLYFAINAWIEIFL